MDDGRNRIANFPQQQQQQQCKKGEKEGKANKKKKKKKKEKEKEEEEEEEDEGREREREREKRRNKWTKAVKRWPLGGPLVLVNSSIAVSFIQEPACSRLSEGKEREARVPPPPFKCWKQVKEKISKNEWEGGSRGAQGGAGWRRVAQRGQGGG